jgi:ATP-dependent RNA helicase DDX1
VNAAESTVDANSVTPSKISTTAPNAPMCIILEPTRELAEQTHNQINKFKKYLDTPKIRFVSTSRECTF